MLTEKFILDALEAERNGQQFPIDFDDIWENAGYSRKDSGIRALLKGRLIPEIDFHIIVGNKVLGISNKHKLSVDASKSFCLAANTDKGEEARRYFIEVEKRYRQHLERSLSLSFDTKSEEPAFPYSSTQIHEWVDYCNRTYTRSVIKNDYEEGIDYIWVEREMYLNADAATILLNAARPRPGVIIPSELKKRPFPWDKLQQFQDNKINRRRSQSHLQSEALGQLSLFD
ncbi:MAG: hypothetical protein KME60_03425 [Cyanomargarita calcarea GSE-NOS-MK-12-04C]|jgi:hypothetical protein|uniref:Uncharacterized protein n=1 Tax=Cyanomargarita calcarea GSE-NOS-MK-12-04C TaxID=2839659 RepID=A0A951UR99_9CYAN|nr:hypothetical protein [Cyanomargarita calcarea GSE-NOS-MK-12-04C]